VVIPLALAGLSPSLVHADLLTKDEALDLACLANGLSAVKFRLPDADFDCTVYSARMSEKLRLMTGIRRSAAGLTLLGIAAVGLGPLSFAQAPSEDAATLFYHAHVFTAEPAQPYAQAIAIR